MKVLITQPNYIPWRGYFYAINLADVFVVYDDVQYTRRDWRNRNLIKTPIGLQWLTIPVQTKGKYLQKINETAIADPRWAAR
ncbi:MAG TPA: WbqC family protein, partial [Chitinophagales bacterium]|nr:WbqC family protein [Chitinophagales bacterium]